MLCRVFILELRREGWTVGKEIRVGQFLSLSPNFSICTYYIEIEYDENKGRHLLETSSDFPLLETSSKTGPSVLNSLDKREEGRPG
jgi:hypothetical protein